MEDILLMKFISKELDKWILIDVSVTVHCFIFMKNETIICY